MAGDKKTKQGNKREAGYDTGNKRFKYIILLFIILLSASGFFLILYGGARYGPASTHVSVAYMYASESLVSGKGLVYFGYDSPFVQWPPLYPLVLSAVNLLINLLNGFLDCNLLHAAGYLNGLSFSLIIFFAGYWLLKGTGSPVISICGSIAVLASIPLTYVSRFVWSEPLFILLLLLFMINLDNYIYRLSLKALVGCIIFAALAFLTRYVGATLIITGCILLIARKGKLINKIVETLIFGFFSSLPAALWMTRNYLLINTLTGGRSPARDSFPDNFTSTFKQLASWFVPGHAESAFYLMLLLALLISVLTVIKNRLIRENPVEKEKAARQEMNGDLAYKIAIPLVFALVYISYLVVSASLVAFDSINDRLLSPAFVPFTMGVFFLPYSFMRAQNGDENGKLRAVLTKSLFIVFFLVWLTYPSSEIVASTLYVHEKGAGILASEWWANSAVIEYVKKIPGGIKIYSNFPDAIYIHTGKKAGYTPKKEGLDLYGLDRFKKIIENEGNAYIAWFDGNAPIDIYDIEELKEHFAMEEIEKLPGGMICKITGLRGFYNEYGE